MTGPLTPAQVVGRLGISRQTLHRWEAAGVLRRLDPAGPPRYRPADVDALSGRGAGTRDRPLRRDRLLRHAAAIIAEQGAAACTVPAVAERAAVSRGAVTHYFPHKDDLLRALTEAFLEGFERFWAAERERDPTAGLATSYIRAAGAPDSVWTPALISCAAERPALLEPVAVRVREWYARLAADATTAELVACLAADGLWLYRLFGIRLPTPDGAAIESSVASQGGHA